MPTTSRPPSQPASPTQHLASSCTTIARSGAAGETAPLAALALLAACGADQYAEASSNQWRYSLDIPADFVRQDVQGIDSAVAQYRGPGAVLSMDHGMYGASPTCAPGTSGCALTEEQLGGQEAAVGRFHFRPGEEQGRGPSSSTSMFAFATGRSRKA
jgi:hypothetical protein